MKNILKNVGLFIFVILISYVLSLTFGELYNKIFKQYGTYVDLRVLSGFSLAFIFFITFFFTVFSGAKKYWWIGIVLIPAVLFEVYFDWQHIYFPIAIGIVGWLVGLGLVWLVEKKR